MARFLITLNMPPGNPEYLVHQVIGDHPADDLAKFCEELNNNAFVIVRQFYFVPEKHRQGEAKWRDRGDLIINTEHIGKVSLYFDPSENQRF